MLAIHQQKQRLDNLFAAVRTMSDPEMQSHWCRYLCVLVSGFLENAVEQCLSEYVARRSHESISNFVDAKLSGFQNPRMGAILDLVGSFNPEWKSRLNEATDGRLSDSVNSIVGNRHKIAHGESVSLSMNSLKAYYKDALNVVVLLQNICELTPLQDQESNER